MEAASQACCTSPQFPFSVASVVPPPLTSASAEDSAAQPRIPHPPHCSLIPHCSDTGCCRSSSSTLGWDGSGVGDCPPLGVPSHCPLPPQLQPPSPRLHGHFQPAPPWPLARFQHYPLCLSSLRSAEGLEASGNQRELGVLVAGEEAQLVPWMKSLGNARQAGAFPLQRWAPTWLHSGVAELDLRRSTKYGSVRR